MNQASHSDSALKSRSPSPAAARAPSDQAPRTWSVNKVIPIPGQSVGGLVALSSGKNLCGVARMSPFMSKGATGDVVLVSVETGAVQAVSEKLVSQEGSTLCVNSDSTLYFCRVSSPPGKPEITTVVALNALTGATIFQQNLDVLGGPIPGGPFAPLAGALDPAGRFLYFGGYSGVLQVDTTNPMTARVFPTSTAIDVNQIAVSPDGLTLFMLGYQGNARLSQVFTAPASNPGQVALLSGIDSASFMGRFALSPDGSVLYLTRVLDVPGGTVAIDALDLSTRTTVGSISLPGLATGANGAQIVSTPLGGVYALWSSGDGESSVSYVDPVANQLTSIGIYEQYAASLTSSSDGTQVFVSFAGDTSSQIFAYSSQ
jgi:hypothetical protein